MNIQNNENFITGLSDEQLCAAARQGERRPEELLLRRYARLVRKIARPYYLAGAEMEDLIQEGMQGLLKAVREFDASLSVPFSAFAERCIRFNIFTAIRNATRKKHRPLNDYVSFESPLFDSVANMGSPSMSLADPETVVLSEEADREFMQAFTGLLSSFEKKVLRLYLDGYSLGEIAAEEHRTYKSVDNAIVRIRKKLLAYHHSSGEGRS